MSRVSIKKNFVGNIRQKRDISDEREKTREEQKQRLRDKTEI